MTVLRRFFEDTTLRFYHGLSAVRIAYVNRYALNITELKDCPKLSPALTMPKLGCALIDI